MQKLWWFFALLAVAGCSSSRGPSVPDDFVLEYRSRSEIMNTETRIRVTKEAMAVYVKSQLSAEVVDELYTLAPAEVESLYQRVQDARFHDIQLPPQELLLDAPEETLSATFGGKSTTHHLSRIKELPSDVVSLRRSVLDLAARKNPKLGSVMG